jgi:polysaccharide export outer membrane protein
MFSMLRLLVCTFLIILLPTFVFAGDYVIGEGDGLDIAVWGVKELSFTVRVRPDGKVTVPGLGDVVASGYTPSDLQKVMADKLKSLVKSPIVTITVREITNSKVYVFGGGVNPGVFDLNRRTTLLQLLCMVGNTPAPAAGAAGGASARVPDYKNAYVLRNGKKIKEGFHKVFAEGDTSQDIIIESNDSIFIPQLLDKNVYVLGAVNTPRFIEYREGMTIMEAIIEAGGFTKFASQNDTIIRRKEKDGERSIPVKVKDLIKDGDLGQNLKLKPGDYVIVKEGLF